MPEDKPIDTNTEVVKPLDTNTEVVKPPTSVKEKAKKFPLWAKIAVPAFLVVSIAAVIFVVIFLQKNSPESVSVKRYSDMNTQQLISDFNSNLSGIVKPAAGLSEYKRNSENHPGIAYRMDDNSFNTLPDVSYGETLSTANAPGAPGASLSEEEINKIRQSAEAYFVNNNWREKIFPSTEAVNNMNNRRYYVFNDIFVCSYSIIDTTGIMLECASIPDFTTSQNEAKGYYDAYKQYAQLHEGMIKANPVVLSVKNGAQALPGYGNKQNDEAIVGGFEYAALGVAELNNQADSDVAYYYRPVNNDWRAYTLQKLENAALDYPVCNSLGLDSDETARAAMANSLCYIGGNSNEVIDYNNYWQNDKCSNLGTCYELGKRRPIEACSSGSNQYFAKFDEDGELLTCISIDEIIAIVGVDAWQSGDWTNTPIDGYSRIGNIFAADQMPDAPAESKCPIGYFAIGHGYPDISFYTCLSRTDESYLQNSCAVGYADVLMGDGSRKCWNTNYTPKSIQITGDDDGDGIGTGFAETVDPNGPEWM